MYVCDLRYQKTQMVEDPKSPNPYEKYPYFRGLRSCKLERGTRFGQVIRSSTGVLAFVGGGLVGFG